MNANPIIQKTEKQKVYGNPFLEEKRNNNNCRKDIPMKEIKIFLASSITELKAERNEMDVFIRRLSDIFEEEYNIKLCPVRCENIDPKYTRERKQEEYNTYLGDCDLAYFIFLTKVGEYTKEEFEVAKKRFEESGRPRYYICVIQKPKECCDTSLFDFLEELEQMYHTSYSRCTNLDEVKLQILLNIRQQEMPFFPITLEGDMLQIIAKNVLSLKHIPIESSIRKDVVAICNMGAEN